MKGGNSMKAETALHDLLSIITQAETDLKRYIQLPTAQEAYINNENLHIQRLTEIYNSIEKIENLNFWEEVESKIQWLCNLDPEIGTIQFKIQVAKHGKSMAMIDFDNGSINESI